MYQYNRLLFIKGVVENQQIFMRIYKAATGTMSLFICSKQISERKQKQMPNFVFSVFFIFSFFIILQQKEYKAFRKHLPYFEGNSKRFAWLQQLKSFFSLFSFLNFKHIHRVSDACTCTITKIKLTNKRREEKGGTQKHMGQNGEEMKRSKDRGWEWRERGSRNRGRQRERQL